MLRQSMVVRALAVLLGLAMSNVVQGATVRAHGLGDLNGDLILDIDDLDESTGAPVAHTLANVDGFGTLFGIAYEYSALANLAHTKLAAFASAASLGPDGGGEIPVIRSHARLSDTLTFESASTDPYDVTFMMNVTGEIAQNGGHASGFASLSVSGDAVDSDFGSYNAPGPHVDTVSVTVTLEGEATVTVDAQLFATVQFLGPGESASADFRGTASDGGDIVLVLPEGVDLTGSESEAWDTAPVPLPAGGWLLLSALLATVPRWRSRWPRSA